MGLLWADTKVNDSWRCVSCKRLMYNKDPRGYPCMGAPIPLYLSEEYSAVCSLCYDMYRALEQADTTYWKGLPTNKFAVVRADPVDKHC